jgi:hypothetical protein
MVDCLEGTHSQDRQDGSGLSLRSRDGEACREEAHGYALHRMEAILVFAVSSEDWSGARFGEQNRENESSPMDGQRQHRARVKLSGCAGGAHV